MAVAAATTVTIEGKGEIVYSSQMILLEAQKNLPVPLSDARIPVVADGTAMYVVSLPSEAVPTALIATPESRPETSPGAEKGSDCARASVFARL